MSTTPEINRSVKFSPYGKPISKSLLTPCRTIGLSRKRKTPCNKTPLTTSITNSKESGLEAATPLRNHISFTPTNHNTTPVTKTESRETKTLGSQVIKRPKRDVKGMKDRTVKKCLDQNFENAIQEENIKVKVQSSKENKNIQINSESNVKPKKCLSNVQVSLERLTDEDIENCNSSKTVEESSSSDEESEEIIKVRKRQAVISSDEENEHFQGFSSKNNIYELKNENLPVKNCEKQTIIKKDVESTCEETLSGKNMCESKSIELHYMEEPKKNLPAMDTKKENNKDTDFQVLSGSSTKSENNQRTFAANDDDDFVNIREKKKLTLTRKESSDKKQKTKDDSKKSKTIKATNSNENNSKTKSLTSIIDDEEDAFTSTPEREKNEKIILVQKVKDLENKVKAKRKKVEDLKQAEIYKTKHNIDELKTLTDVWQEGCVKGLNELLKNLQMHGPIDMLTLVKNLKIPSDIVERCLKLNLMNKKSPEQKNDSEDFDVSPN